MELFGWFGSAAAAMAMPRFAVSFNENLNVCVFFLCVVGFWQQTPPYDGAWFRINSDSKIFDRYSRVCLWCV